MKRLIIEVGSDDRIHYEFGEEGDEYDAGAKRFRLKLPGGFEGEVGVDYRGDWAFEIDLPEGATIEPVEDEE